MEMIEFKVDTIPPIDELVDLYKSVGWQHANCPKALEKALSNSDFVVTAWYGKKLVGLGRAISDKSLTVYFPDLLVHPEWQGKKVGSKLLGLLFNKYSHYHNQMLVAEDVKAQKFYLKSGFINEPFALTITKPFPIEDQD